MLGSKFDQNGVENHAHTIAKKLQVVESKNVKQNIIFGRWP